MIVEAKTIENNTIFETDICIIGSGPAGISIALEMQKTNKRIIVLAGGIANETVANQDLNKGFVSPKGTHEPLEENRRRTFGGSSTVWGGRCIPFDAIDFKERSWIPNSGWPIRYDDLVEHYEKASLLCKCGIFEYDAIKQFKNLNSNEIIEGIDNQDLMSSKLERWSTPVNFAKDYLGILKTSENIQVLLDTNLISICTEKQDEVSSISARVDGKTIKIKACTYILACGGIENPRLLLSSRNLYYPNGIGNNNDVVGRYYMAHFLGTYIALAPTNRKNIIFDFERDLSGVYCRRRWWVTEEAQKQRKIGNAIFFLHQANNQDGHRDVLFSIVFVAKFFISLLTEKSKTLLKKKWLKSKEDVYGHLNVIIKEGWKQIPTIIKITLKRFQKRRLPFVLPDINSKKLGLYFQTEHMPNSKSRITLVDNEIDALGIPRVSITINFTDLDKKTIIEAHRIFAERYTKSGIGAIHFKENELIEYIEKKIKMFNSAAHHLGTTRMSENPKFGVVDKNCKVHGINNLYIAGSSVFPTGSHVNPTLTIVALSVRLANYLNKLQNE